MTRRRRWCSGSFQRRERCSLLVFAVTAASSAESEMPRVALKMATGRCCDRICWRGGRLQAAEARRLESLTLLAVFHDKNWLALTSRRRLECLKCSDAARGPSEDLSPLRKKRIEGVSVAHQSFQCLIDVKANGGARRFSLNNVRQRRDEERAE